MAGNANTKYFEDFSLGDQFTTDAITIDQCDINLFAGFSGDYNPLHTNEEFARPLYGGRIAHGFATVSKMTGKFNQLGFWDGSVMAMLENGWSFLLPVRPGDTIHSELTIGELVESKKKNKGAVRIDFDVRNQRDETVIKGFLRLMLRKRP